MNNRFPSDSVNGTPSVDAPYDMTADLAIEQKDREIADLRAENERLKNERDLAVRATRGKERQSCSWLPDGESIFSTSCGKKFFFDAEGPKENSFQFCPFCGMTLKSAGCGEVEDGE